MKHYLIYNSNHSDHVNIINVVKNNLVSVGNLENEVNSEIENELINTKSIGYY